MSKNKHKKNPLTAYSPTEQDVRKTGFLLTVLALLFAFIGFKAAGSMAGLAMIGCIFCIWYVRKMIKKTSPRSAALSWGERKENRYLLAAGSMAFLTASLAQGSCSLGVAVICIGITLVAVLRKPSKPAAQSGSSLQPQAQESLPPLPKTPAKMPSAAAMRPEFAKRLAMLNNLRNELESREDSVSSFLDDYFEGSTISKSRYLQVIQNARHVLKTNSDKALQAVKLFGNANPTPERIEILDAYVKDSRDVMNGVEKVINELIKVQQSDVLNDGDKLDELLTDLTRTTSYYQKQQRSH